MNDQTLALILAATGVVLTALAQILLKKGALRAHGGPLWLAWLHPFALAGYSLLFGVTLLNLAAFRVLPLKLGVVFLPWTFILVALFSRWMLKEKFDRNQILGASLVVAGIVIFNL